MISSAAGKSRAAFRRLPMTQVRQAVTVRTGVEQWLAKKIVKLLKESKLKVQGSIQGDAVRVSGAKKDELQEAIALTKKSVTDFPLQYQNFLANPNPTGRSSAVYVYETAKRTAEPTSVTSTDDNGSEWPVWLAVALAVVGAGGLVVLWAHS